MDPEGGPLMATPALRLVEPSEQHVPVPAGLLAAAIDNAGCMADDLAAGVDAVAQRIFADNRAAALNELGRLHHRVEAFRDAFAALDPHPSKPPRPHRVA
jgi:antitoxin component HigA of HigAB toxin-antitoxin module